MERNLPRSSRTCPHENARAHRLRRATLLAIPCLALGACAGGTMADALDGGSEDALVSGSEDPWRKPAEGSTDPGTAGDPAGGGVDSPQGPPSAKPPEGSCGGVDAAGVCKGAVAFWCEAGEVRSQDCRALGTSCEFFAESGGFRCSPLGGDPGGADPGGADPGGADPGGADPGGADPGGADPGGGDPGGGDPGADPGGADPGGADPGGADPGGADPGGAGDACGGIDYLGECQGDVAVWCDGGVLHQTDCQALQTTCGWVDETTGNYCLPAPGGGAVDAGPPPDLPTPDAGPPPVDPPPAGGCDLGFLGECQGDVARYCLDDALVEVDCAADGRICTYISDVVGYYCTAPAQPDPAADACGGIDYLGECQGDVVVWCDAGQLYSVDCAATGEICDWISEAGGYYCTTL